MTLLQLKFTTFAPCKSWIMTWQAALAVTFIYILLTRNKYNLIFRHSCAWTLWTFWTSLDRPSGLRYPINTNTHTQLQMKTKHNCTTFPATTPYSSWLYSGVVVFFFKLYLLIHLQLHDFIMCDVLCFDFIVHSLNIVGSLRIKGVEGMRCAMERWKYKYALLLKCLLFGQHSVHCFIFTQHTLLCGLF